MCLWSQSLVDDVHLVNDGPLRVKGQDYCGWQVATMALSSLRVVIFSSSKLIVAFRSPTNVLFSIWLYYTPSSCSTAGCTKTRWRQPNANLEASQSTNQRLRPRLHLQCMLAPSDLWKFEHRPRPWQVRHLNQRKDSVTRLLSDKPVIRLWVEIVVLWTFKPESSLFSTNSVQEYVDLISCRGGLSNRDHTDRRIQHGGEAPLHHSNWHNEYIITSKLCLGPLWILESYFPSTYFFLHPPWVSYTFHLWPTRGPRFSSHDVTDRLHLISFP